ncbi:MAG: hypothetical protein M3336_08100 [Chloroflexota bacterium]|nr:hypothetical protein [Chloroflexota bacterium]
MPGQAARAADWARWISVRPRPPRTGVAYVAVRIVVYIAVLTLIVLIYGTKQRGLLTAPPIGALCALATWYLLGDTTVEGRRRVVLSAGVGLLLAELTWALGYWSTVPLVGGAALWLAFYVLSGVIEAGTSGVLERRVALEYALVAAIGVLVVLAVSRPWGA